MSVSMRLVLPTVALALVLGTTPASAQEDPGCWLRDGVTPEQAAQRASPRDSASVSLDAGVAKVCYGAPSARGRDIMGGLVPFGQPWRGGADEATALHLTFPAEVAGVSLEPGSYSLYFLPGEQGWIVNVNSVEQRWGIPIDSGVMGDDIGQGSVSPEETGETVEQMRYEWERVDGNRANLVLEWENTRVPIPVEATTG